MKTKTFNKKLSLTRQTVAHLDVNDQEKVKGGLSGLSCFPPCITLSCVYTVCNCPTQCGSIDACSC